MHVRRVTYVMHQILPTCTKIVSTNVYHASSEYIESDYIDL